jgi:hypothetical protein
MSAHWDDRETMERRIRRALVVEEFGSVSWQDYIQASKQRQ